MSSPTCHNLHQYHSLQNRGTPVTPYSITKRAAVMASGGLGLVDYLAVRQCLLELLYAFVGDLGAAEDERF